MWGVGSSATVPSGVTNNDVFYWLRGDAGTTGAFDEVRDFKPWDPTAASGAGAGMKIDISGLLENHIKGDTTNLANWISISTATSAEIAGKMGSVSGGTNGMKLVIDVDGPGGYNITQTVYLRSSASWNTAVVDPMQWVNNGWLVV